MRSLVLCCFVALIGCVSAKEPKEPEPAKEPERRPGVDGDRVYLYGSEGMLYCLRTADGKPLWKVDTKKDYGIVQNFFGVGSAPVVEGDLLIVQTGGSPPDSDPDQFARVKGNGTGVVAFDKRTGKEK